MLQSRRVAHGPGVDRFLFGLAFGGLVGVALGILLIPEVRTRTRHAVLATPAAVKERAARARAELLWRYDRLESGEDVAIE